MVERFADGDESTSKLPAGWSHSPSDYSLQRQRKNVMWQRSQSCAELTKKNGALFGSLLHAVKNRPEVGATLSLVDSPLTEEMYHQHLLRNLVHLGGTLKWGTTFNRYINDPN